MRYPNLYAPGLSRETVEVFGGYDHNFRIGSGAFHHMENITGTAYPVLSPRPPRGILEATAAPGGLIAKDSLCHISGTAFVMNGYRVELGLSEGEKQLVSMGAYVLIFPDRKWINTLDLTQWGSIDASFTTASDVTVSLCSVTGEPYTGVTASDAAPEDASVWLDTSGAEPVLKQLADGVWTAISAYVRLASPGIGKAFDRYDGVTVSGILQAPELNGAAVLWEKGEDFLVVPGVISQPFTQSHQAGAVTVERRMPEMDFVIECGNRLWGCRYGLNRAGQPVNELYASKLGDFKNWSCFMGLSTDSWVCPVGTDGPFTGAVTHLGHPVFFKEQCLHKVYLSASGGHQVQDTACRGVKKGSGRSLAMVGETLLYHAPSGICAYDGSLPEEVSRALGQERYTGAVAGAVGNRYFVSMLDSAGRPHLFVYDTGRSLWYREDGFRSSVFCPCGGELYAAEAETGRIYAMLGSAGAEEAPVHWALQTGLLGLGEPDRKYITRLGLRLWLAAGTEMTISIRYGEGEPWVPVGALRGDGLDTRTVPIRPRRCDHLQLQLEGTGSFRLYGLTKYWEKGSDCP